MIKLKNLIPESSIVPESDEEFEFKRGFLLAQKDYMKGNDRELDSGHLPPAFLLGYKKGLKKIKKQRGDTWWNKFNDKMTDMLGRMGSSRLR